MRVTAENFRVREVSADMAYSSKRNLHAVEDAGGTAYNPFKKNATGQSGKPDALWAKMYHLFTLNEAEFNRHYHKRSNVRDGLSHDEVEVRRRGARQDAGRAGQRGAREGTVPQHLCARAGGLRAGHRASVRARCRRRATARELDTLTIGP